MHVRLKQKGKIDFGADLNEDLPPSADIVFISAHDSELAQLARAADVLLLHGKTLSLCNYLSLFNPQSIPLFVEKTLARARIVVLRMIGGSGYWPEGIEALQRWSRLNGITLLCLPGGSQWDETFASSSSGVSLREVGELWRYFAEGGASNIASALLWLARATGAGAEPEPARPMPVAGFLTPGDAQEADALLVIYRALAQAEDTEPVEAIASTCTPRGMRLSTIYVSSLKDTTCRDFVRSALAVVKPELILSAIAFSADTNMLFGDLPVLQIAFAGQARRDWAQSARGLPPADLAMHVVMPEVDGRIFVGPCAFKVQPALEGSGARSYALLQSDAQQVGAIADRMAATIRLRRTERSARRVVLMLANYPNRDGRIANGVGLDTPASVASTLKCLQKAGYEIGAAPTTPADLMERIGAGVTNRSNKHPAIVSITWSLAEYRAAFKNLPQPLQAAALARWGDAERDPHCVGGTFQLALHRFGNVVIGIQPSRGYDIDPAATFHDPDLVPPHRYIATYLWLRQVFDAHALIHFGKHGNLEWLPGKAVGLSPACWPQALLGPLPHIYPFIVNDPGEGVQAKRRSSAVIVDHLTPPLARAGLHDELAKLENLVDEYALAQDLDPKRARYLGDEITSIASALALDKDLGFASINREEAVRRIDAHLCDLKEMQIRDGLHVFGELPNDEQLSELALAIARCPRFGVHNEAASLVRALSEDLGLEGFDPLTRDLAAPYHGPRPAVLLACSEKPWRTAGDTVERLESLALEGLRNPRSRQPGWQRSEAVFAWIGATLLPALRASPAAEQEALLRALDGIAIPPGPSGAPTRGRPDVLPTGRNFFAVDPRAIPTPAAWKIGQASAEALIRRHREETGDWLRSVAFSAWGTANMRTGGDDIAQALALIGCQPVWEEGSGRVTGFEILTSQDLKRPRVDVTFRVSGLFRDAFPTQLDLIDSAIRAVAELDERNGQNPIAEAFRAEGQVQRVFGSKPGAYGAGLQALIDEQGWTDRHDFAEVYLAWGGYAYGQGQEGIPARDLLARRLSDVDAVVQTQDNREHDILDSDDYYQFLGGLAATVESLSGRAPRVYLTDTSRPEAPLTRSLDEEIARVVRGRAANSKWIAGMMRHGYKGAFEMAATVDYLFAFAATTNSVKSHHFDQLYDRYVADERVRRFMIDANPDALREIASRLIEAIRRELWTPRSNSALPALQKLAQN